MFYQNILQQNPMVLIIIIIIIIFGLKYLYKCYKAESYSPKITIQEYLKAKVKEEATGACKKKCDQIYEQKIHPQPQRKGYIPRSNVSGLPSMGLNVTF